MPLEVLRRSVNRRRQLRRPRRLVQLRHSGRRRHRPLLLRLLPAGSDRARLVPSRPGRLSRRRPLGVQRLRTQAVRLRPVRLGHLRRRLGLDLEPLDNKQRERRQLVRPRSGRPLHLVRPRPVRSDNLNLNHQLPLRRRSGRRARLGNPQRAELERLRLEALVRSDKPLRPHNLLHSDPPWPARPRTIQVGSLVPSLLPLTRPRRLLSPALLNEARRSGITC